MGGNSLSGVFRCLVCLVVGPSICLGFLFSSYLYVVARSFSLSCKSIRSLSTGPSSCLHFLRVPIPMFRHALGFTWWRFSFTPSPLFAISSCCYLFLFAFCGGTIYCGCLFPCLVDFARSSAFLILVVRADLTVDLRIATLMEAVNLAPLGVGLDHPCIRKDRLWNAVAGQEGIGTDWHEQ